MGRALRRADGRQVVVAAAGGAARVVTTFAVVVSITMASGGCVNRRSGADDAGATGQRDGAQPWDGAAPADGAAASDGSTPPPIDGDAARPTPTCEDCAGCCDGVTCLPGNGNAACGTNGRACVACGDGTECVGGACLPPGGCAGCLLATGECVPGGDDAACGTGGDTCRDCATHERCEAGTCAGNRDCNASNCDGCCDGATCLPGNTNISCGKRGSSCEFCVLPTTCGSSGEGERCQSHDCAGCYNGLGLCQAGESETACGTGGFFCDACAPTERCIAGRCAVPCGPDTCSGCCDGDRCVLSSAQSIAACGPAGASCQRCPEGGTCSRGACSAPRTCSGCDFGECCDTRTGECTLTTPSLCGETGAACTLCPGGQACGLLQLTCGAPGSLPIGSACTADHQCAPGRNTGRPFCLTDLPGGACTDLCSASTPCAAGSSCVAFGGINICLKTCTALGSFSTCGRGSTYSCEFVGSGGVCVPACGTAADCGGGGTRCEFFGEGNRCCGTTSLPCCPAEPQCTGFNAAGARPSACGEGARNYCS